MDYAHESRICGGSLWRFSLIASVFLGELGSKVSFRVRVEEKILDLRRNEKVKPILGKCMIAGQHQGPTLKVSIMNLKRLVNMVVPFSS